MDMTDYFRMLGQLFRLAVWDQDGKMYCPLFGYDRQIEAYALAEDAITVFNKWACESISNQEEE